MDARRALELGLETADLIALGYVQDLSDAEWMLRPHPACNHLNWQIGHLISAEHQMANAVSGGGMPALPAGFAESYTKETASSDDASRFRTKAQLLEEYRRQREGTRAALARCTAEELDRPSGLDYAPTVGAVFALQSAHWIMHAGQWVIVRRQLGKPALF